MADNQPTTQPPGADSDRRFREASTASNSMTIWGWKSIRRQVGSGVFACPSEETERAYWVYRVRSWFTVFSIPLIPVRVLAEQVECFCCGRVYDRESLGLAL